MGLSEGGSNSVVESQPSKLLVAGSIPVSRSRIWRRAIWLAAQPCGNGRAALSSGGAARSAANSQVAGRLPAEDDSDF